MNRFTVLFAACLVLAACAPAKPVPEFVEYTTLHEELLAGLFRVTSRAPAHEDAPLRDVRWNAEAGRACGPQPYTVLDASDALYNGGGPGSPLGIARSAYVLCSNAHTSFEQARTLLGRTAGSPLAMRAP